MFVSCSSNDKSQKVEFSNPNIQKPNEMYGNAGIMVEGWELKNVMLSLTQKEVDWTVGQIMQALNNDIGETTNVYDKHPEVVDELQKLLEKYKVDGRSVLMKN